MNSSSMEQLDDSNVNLHRTKFFILLLLQIPSVMLYLLIFTFFGMHRSLLKTPKNKALLLLLLINFLEASCDLPNTIHFYRLGRVSPATSAYCTWWTFFEYTLSVSSEFLMAIISIQRHILVFNNNILQIRIKRYLWHHLPLLLGVAYPTLLYLGLVVIYPCDGTQWDYTSVLCGLSNCYLENSSLLATLDWALDNGMPILIIVVANAALVIRVICYKRRAQQATPWQKQRRMTIQLLIISSVYFIAWIPNTIIAVIQEIIDSSFVAEIQANYFFDLLYLVCLLMPWVCIMMLPELKKWMWKLFRSHQSTQNIVVPLNITVLPMKTR
ncbi:unnamed protein product [Adineta steineri]|uniref:G-protein coupled receptors family 1 profile domain-containing protein n=1 Tax=Adineta steineri TaxID=433720 RepID=A0A815IWQ0_9BILA|nr:unnamed protein product [Adineta steineri]CAF1372191.1 unnamed protein product [Adineta steineri]CAF4073714.1 unnamed protein product [Adineta steineri]CAF4164512.1 unnamed protein product [Adineta steineri]